MDMFDFSGLRLDVAFRFVFLDYDISGRALKKIADACALNCISKLKLNRLIVYLKSSADDIGTTIPEVFMATPVSREIIEIIGTLKYDDRRCTCCLVLHVTAQH